MWKPGDKVRVCEVLGRPCKAEVLEVRAGWDKSEGFVARRFDERERFAVRVLLLEDSSGGHRAGTKLWVRDEDLEDEGAWK